MYFHLYEIRGRHQLETAVKAMKIAMQRHRVDSEVQLANPRFFHDKSYFVGIAFDTLEKADKAKKILSAIPGYSDNFFHYCSIPSREVGEFLSGELVDSLVHRILQVEPDQTEDPYNLAEPVISTHSFNCEQSSFLHDRLYWYLSAAGHGRWSYVIRAAETLGLATSKTQARRAFRNLLLLGHAALSPDGARWSMLPQTLLQRADRPDRGFLAGQFLPALEKNFSESALLKKSHQQEGQGPMRITLDWTYACDNHEELTHTGGRISNGYEAIVSALPILTDWQRNLKTVAIEPFEAWSASRWDPSTESFKHVGSVSAANFREWGSGFYRLTNNGPVPIERYVFGDNATATLYTGDWYGLRWLAATMDKSENYDVAWHPEHDSEHIGTLVVPYSRRWPLLYERALVLAKGKLPARDSNSSRLLYGGIPLNTAKALAAKVGANLKCIEDSNNA